MSQTQLILTRVIEAYGKCLAFQADIETHFIGRRLNLSGDDTPEGLSMLMREKRGRESLSWFRAVGEKRDGSRCLGYAR